MQLTPLYSQDGTVYLELLANGALTLFNTASGAVIYTTGAVTNPNPPFKTVMQTVRSMSTCMRAAACGPPPLTMHLDSFSLLSIIALPPDRLSLPACPHAWPPG